MLRPKKRLLVAVALLGFGVAAVGIAYAAIPSGNTITACYGKPGDNLRVIDAATTNCKKNETQLTWSSGDPCLTAVSGVYLNLIGQASNLVSSSLLTITPQGVIQVTDSDQDGDAGVFDPFTAASGVVTQCTTGSNNTYSVTGYTLNYVQPELAGHPDPGLGTGMSRVNYAVTITPATAQLVGSLALTLGLAPNAGAGAAKTGIGTLQIPNVPIQGERLQ